MVNTYYYGDLATDLQLKTEFMNQFTMLERNGD